MSLIVPQVPSAPAPVGGHPAPPHPPSPEFVPLRLPPPAPRGAHGPSLIQSPTERQQEACRPVQGRNPRLWIARRAAGGESSGSGISSGGRGAAKKVASQYIRRVVPQVPDALSLLDTGGSCSQGQPFQGSKKSAPHLPSPAGSLRAKMTHPSHSVPHSVLLPALADLSQPVHPHRSKSLQGSLSIQKPGTSSRYNCHEAGDRRRDLNKGASGALAQPSGSRSDPHDPISTDSVTVTAENARQGLSVTRGRDWCHGDQDGGLDMSSGVLLGPSNVLGYWLVRWSHGKVDVYRVGAGGKFDLKWLA